MANPAELLHKQLMSWSDGNTKSAASIRKLEQSKVNEAVWADHRLAIQRVLDIEEALTWAKQQGHDVSVYDEQIARWTSQIFAFPHGWYDAGHPTITKVPMDQLKSVAALLNFVIPVFKPEGEAQFAEFIAVAAMRVSALPDEHKFLREHALRVLRHLKGCLADIEIHGEFKLVSALSELQSILDALNEATNGNDSFFARAKSGVWNFFTKKSSPAIVVLGAVGAGILQAGGTEFYEALVSPQIHEAIEWSKTNEIGWVKPPELTQPAEVSGTLAENSESGDPSKGEASADASDKSSKE